ncbi:TIR-like domain-containing protein [Rudanella paleaurantiibacter]|uniref:TIR-like domain-containing protein n=1 Tax=Rudanella paleaurantiibacter TaxID=2614655 RepID=A0A7J5TS23_9BACT|nr:TIR domain-containing protein [Rudanella paleaurantiibacter]KAB7725844.1 TIR-like domain-containing protein [Rudanella paleaurantiibacter]
MAGKKVFVSYDHSEDLRYKDLLRAWDANTSFDFSFDQRSPNVAIDSDDAGRIKASLTTKMKEADYLLVIIGSKSYASKWMTWEIERAKMSDVKLKLAAVKIDSQYTTPSGLYGTGTAFTYSFTLNGIVDALSRASNNY